MIEFRWKIGFPLASTIISRPRKQILGQGESLCQQTCMAFVQPALPGENFGNHALAPDFLEVGLLEVVLDHQVPQEFHPGHRRNLMMKAVVVLDNHLEGFEQTCQGVVDVIRYEIRQAVHGPNDQVIVFSGMDSGQGDVPGQPGPG